ncbi:MAG: hypothetical protein JWM80_1208 [Cyanobacteria bacterium RYN_339]|nr:hypothetical protein [Cyanobacteria bacterium RYN_339]
MNDPTAVLILAAGASTRLGHPKQLVQFRGKPLLAHAIEAATAADLGPIWVVLGAHAAEIRPVVSRYGVRVVTNRDWATGLAGSIRAGLSAIAPGLCQDLLLMLCDQPCLEPDHLISLVAARRACARAIAASEYNGQRGVPAVFARAIWPELLALTGQHGAREVVARDPARVVALPFAWGALDVDTAADVAALAKL